MLKMPRDPHVPFVSPVCARNHIRFLNELSLLGILQILSIDLNYLDFLLPLMRQRDVLSSTAYFLKMELSVVPFLCSIYLLGQCLLTNFASSLYPLLSLPSLIDASFFEGPSIRSLLLLVLLAVFQACPQ